MKVSMVALGAALILAAGCRGAPPNEKILTQQCDTLFAEPDLAEQASRNPDGVSMAEFCACYAKTVVADTSLIDLHKEVLVQMNNTVEAEGLTADDAAKSIEAKIDAGDFEGFTGSELDDVGDYLQDIAGSMVENEGVCPA